MLITESYRALNKKLHESNPSYGISGQKYVREVESLVGHFNAKSVLDYGCGKGTLKTGLGSPDYVNEYDPAIPGKDSKPEPADLVTCTDVMEHIEPDCVDNVLLDISSLTKKAAYLVVATFPANKTLPDGRNAHLIQRGRDYWDEKINKYFDRVDAMEQAGNIYYLGIKTSDA